MNILEALLVQQHTLQQEAMGIDPAMLQGEERMEYIRMNVLALEDELHEMLQEVGWKPWSSSNHVNVDAALGEMVDALHFFLNLLLVIGLPQEQNSNLLASKVLAKYTAKNRRNRERQEEGYDGVSSKCPSCRREIVDFEDLGGDVLRCPCGATFKDPAT